MLEISAAIARDLNGDLTEAQVNEVLDSALKHVAGLPAGEAMSKLSRRETPAPNQPMLPLFEDGRADRQ